MQETAAAKVGKGELAVTEASSAIKKLLVTKIHICCLFLFFFSFFLLMFFISPNVLRFALAKQIPLLGFLPCREFLMLY